MTKMNSFQMTREFHRAFGLPVHDSPREPTVEERILRAKLLMEETLETITEGLGVCVDMDYARPGIKHRFRIVHEGAEYDPVETLDGLAVVKVIANGTAVQFGLPMEEADREVFESNMSKLDKVGKPIVNRCQIPECYVDETRGGCDRPDHLIDPTQPVGKILKGPNYRKPNIEGLLR